jgi:hypothetical protein
MSNQSKSLSALKRQATPDRSEILNSKVLANPGTVTDVDGNEV